MLFRSGYVFASRQKRRLVFFVSYHFDEKSCVAAMELSVLRAQASSLAHFLFKPGVSMSKRCLFILFCLFICITQYAYADYTVSESQIDSVINWAGENRSGYTNKCGAYVFEAFQFKLGSPPFFSSNGKDCAYGRGFSHSGLTCDSSKIGRAHV